MAVFQAGRFALPLHRTYVMGILNVTPDSFSDGGRYCVPRPGGLPPNVDDVRAVPGHLQGVGHGGLGDAVPAPVGEGIGGDV